MRSGLLSPTVVCKLVSVNRLITPTVRCKLVSVSRLITPTVTCKLVSVNRLITFLQVRNTIQLYCQGTNAQGLCHHSHHWRRAAVIGWKVRGLTLPLPSMVNSAWCHSDTSPPQAENTPATLASALYSTLGKMSVDVMINVRLAECPFVVKTFTLQFFRTL